MNYKLVLHPLSTRESKARGLPDFHGSTKHKCRFKSATNKNSKVTRLTESPGEPLVSSSAHMDLSLEIIACT